MIIHVITNFAELGGAESALIRIINENVNKKTTLISLMLTSDDMISRIKHPDCKILALGASNFLLLFLSTFKLASIINSQKPQKIYSWMYHANAIAALACLFSFKRSKLIWGVRHSLDDYNGEKNSTKIAIQLGKLLKFIPQKVVYCSKKSQTQHEKYGYNERSKSVYIPNGYSFSPLHSRSFNKASFVIGAAGRFHDAKDYLTLFLAIKQLKDKGITLELRVCGRGMSQDNNELLSLIKSTGLCISDIHLLGEITNMVTFYNQIDIFVLSSKTEGFPNVLAEAAAQGCAVFSTDVGDAPFIINNDDHIVAVKDPMALAECIYCFIKKPLAAKQQAIALTSQHVRNNFCIANIAKRFSEV